MLYDALEGSPFPSLPAWLVTASLLTPFAPAWSAPPSNPAHAVDRTSGTKSSFAHSVLKTVTYEIGNTLNNFAFLTVGAGGLTGGVLLTAFNTLQSWTVYTTNDYLSGSGSTPERRTRTPALRLM